MDVGGDYARPSKDAVFVIDVRYIVEGIILTTRLALPETSFGGVERARTGRVSIGGQGAVAVKVIRAGKGGRVWLGSSQLTPILVTCHTPWIVGVVSRAGLSPLHTSEVLAARPRVIANICVLSFIFCSFV